MNTLIFYVMLCSSPSESIPADCNSFEPYTWNYSNEQEREQAFRECEILSNAYDQLQATKESDCYIEE